MGAKPRDGFALLVALLAIVVIVMLAAVAITPNMVPRIDTVRVNTARSVLSALTEGDQQIVAFNTELGKYPRLLSQLAKPITGTDTDLCGKTYTNASVTSWRPYLDRVVPASGMPVSVGVARDTLVRQDVDNQSALLIVDIPGVAVEDAEALDRRTDPSPSSTAGKVQWGAVSGEGLVALQWVMEISACPAAGGGGGGGGGKNTAPTSSFTFACTGLACGFTDTSSDPDGSVVAWSWSFGTGATSTVQHPTYTYPTAGTYTVTVTVTDNAGATGTSSQSVTVSAPGTILLAVTGSTSKGNYFADLSWSGASSVNVDVYRNGVLITTTANDGAHTDALGKNRGTYTYMVCEAGTATCSNEASVTF